MDEVAARLAVAAAVIVMTGVSGEIVVAAVVAAKVTGTVGDVAAGITSVAVGCELVPPWGE